jgi:type III restriction enzyme
MKEEAREALVHHQQPSNSLDCLFIVEHPRFRAFYDSLRQDGYFIGSGKTQPRSIAGDLIQVELLPARVPEFDIAWPVQIFEASTKPDLSQIDLSQLPPCKLTFEYSLNLARTKIADTHLDTGTKAKTWRLEKDYYDFNHFIRTTTNALAKEGRTALLTAHKAAIAALVEHFATNRFWGGKLISRKPRTWSRWLFQWSLAMWLKPCAGDCETDWRNPLRSPERKLATAFGSAFAGHAGKQIRADTALHLPAPAVC